MSLTTDRNDPRLIEGQKNETGQHEIYLVLSEEERSKGFVRPVRNTYVHVGKRIDVSKMRQLTDEERERYKDYGYAGFIPEEKRESAVIGTFIKQSDLKSGCGTETTMGNALAETYARDPKFYGATYCCGCGKHLPVQEFVWKGTNETVGS